MNFNQTRMIPLVLLPAVWLLASCGGGSSSAGNSTDNFSVDQPLSVALVSQGIPQDIAQFFAAAQFSSRCSDDTACTFSYTYPNGARRDLSLTAVAVQYTPSAEEISSSLSLVSPVFDGHYAGSGIEDSPAALETQVAISYFVPTSSMSSDTFSSQAAISMAKPPAARTAQLNEGANPGYQFNWSESASKGADVAIGSVLEYYKDIGQAASTTGSAYAVASAISDIAGAAIISQQVKAWLAELDALERCAADPTNPITQTDPNYTATTVAGLRAARSELKQITAVRFINAMGETGAGIHPATAVLSIPLKQAYVWTEQTLKDSSESLMRDARASVVSCKPSCPTSLTANAVSESQIDISWSGSIGNNALTGYIIDGGNSAGNSTTATAYSDTGLARSTNYCYTVSAYNDYGSAENCPQACDTTFGPPVVVSTGPANNSTAVSVQTAVTATLSKEVDSATVTGATFTLAGPSGSIGGSVSYSGTTATFSPATDLDYSTVYTATLTSGVIDLDGVALEANHVWRFTTEDLPLAGNLQFTTNVTDGGVSTLNGVANVTWTLTESLPDVRSYSASGTISGNLVPVFEGFTCAPVAASSTISTSGKLLVYTAANQVWPNTHAFTLTADDINSTLTTDCTENGGGVTIPLSFPRLLYVFVGGNCLPNVELQPVPYTDAAQLSGSYSCDSGLTFSATSASWSFSTN